MFFFLQQLARTGAARIQLAFAKAWLQSDSLACFTCMVNGSMRGSAVVWARAQIGGKPNGHLFIFQEHAGRPALTLDFGIGTGRVLNRARMPFLGNGSERSDSEPHICSERSDSEQCFSI